MVDGGCQATASLLDLLAKAGYQTEGVALYSDKHPYVAAAFAGQTTPWRFHYVDIAVRPGALVKHMVQGIPYNIARYFRRNILQQLMEQMQTRHYDAVICDSLYMAPYAWPLIEKAKCTVWYRAHNIESNIWRDNARLEKNLLRKTYFALLSNQLRRFEHRFAQQAHGVLAISSADMPYFLSLNPKTVYLPPAVPLHTNVEEKPFSQNLGLRLGMIGSFLWLPNQYGLAQVVQWLRKQPQAHIQLVIAGSHAPAVDAPNVTVLGYVADLTDFYHRIDAVVSPLFSGGGIKMKVLEAMRYGKPVLSTTKGVEGLPVQPYIHYVPFEDAQTFFHAVDRLRDPQTYRTLVQNCYRLLATEFAAEPLANRLVAFLES